MVATGPVYTCKCTVHNKIKSTILPSVGVKSVNEHTVLCLADPKKHNMLAYLIMKIICFIFIGIRKIPMNYKE